MSYYRLLVKQVVLENLRDRRYIEILVYLKIILMKLQTAMLLLRSTLFTILSVLLTTAHAEDYERQMIQKRIAPVGKVRLQKTEAEKQAEQQAKTEQPLQVVKAPGEAVYQQYCVVCHKDGLAGAPKFRVEADWKPRLAKMDIDQLTISAIKGKNAMPAKGTCLDCSEKDIKEAIEYMLPGKKE